MIRLLHRRPLGLLNPSSLASAPNQYRFLDGTRHASLSAIHRGLRKSERVQYGHRRPGEQPTETRRIRNPSANALTEKALEGAGSKRQRLKLLRKLKKKQQEEDGTGPTTRRKRFIDPNFSFGKDSIVYKLKYGSLKGMVKDLDLDEPVKPRSFGERARDSTRQRASPPLRNDDPPRRRESDIRQGGLGRKRDYEPRRSDGGDIFRQPNRSRPRDDGREPPAPRERRGNMTPMTIKYTTAASEFLYGRSVVKAALQHGRRKFYHLYTMGGGNRLESKDEPFIKQLANRQNIPITIVPTESQQLMDKMSMGRPHNGFVLESSPLPQQPVAALGKVEDSVLRSGFHVELDHQTKEELAVNGTENFYNRPRKLDTNPFVLLLHEIVDPGNLGALLRTASYLGVDAVGITSRSSSKMTPVVLKSAAGAVEEMRIFSVASAETFIERSKMAGWKFYAAVAPPGSKLTRLHDDKFVSTDAIESNTPLREHPCVLILGNEGEGLSKPVKVAADYELSVPRFVQDSSVDSLNVSVAAGLLCHAFMKRNAAAAQNDRNTTAAYYSNGDKTLHSTPKEQEAIDEDRLF